MTISVKFFAALRDEAGKTQEELPTTAETPEDVFEELALKYGFKLSQQQVRYAVNGAYVDPRHTLSEGDELVIIPPIAGG